MASPYCNKSRTCVYQVLDCGSSLLFNCGKPMSSYMEVQACWHLVTEDKGHKIQTMILKIQDSNYYI
jgi:hypothetical protein